MNNKNEIQNGIDFVITLKCNYRCPYCDQGTNKDNYISASDEVVDAFIDYLKTTPKKYRIHIVGGEPTIHPRFMDVIEGIIKYGHTFEIGSNFSLPLKFWKKVVDSAGENLTIVQVSYHPTQIKDKKAFCDKVIEFSKMKNPKTRFFISAVLNEENYDEIVHFQQLTEGHNIELELQHERDLKGNFVQYNDKLSKFLENNTHIDGMDLLKENNLYGTICTTGINFFSIGPDGNIIRCYGDQSRLTSLGNIKDFCGEYKFPMPCFSEKCTCTLPYQYGCIHTEKKNMPLANVLKFASKHRKLSNLLKKIMLKNAKSLVNTQVQGGEGNPLMLSGLRFVDISYAA